MDDVNIVSSYTIEDGIEDGQFVDLSGPLRLFLRMDHDVRRFKFAPMRIVVTGGIMAWLPTLSTGARDVRLLAAPLARHLSGDWGGVSVGDAAANDRDLASQEGRLLSSYELPNNAAGATAVTKIWIITEPGVTTILLPEEY